MDTDKLYNWFKTVAEDQQAKITRREERFFYSFSKEQAKSFLRRGGRGRASLHMQ